MQIREQGKKIQCIRSAYDTTTKRSHQKVVATINRWTDTLASADLDALTDVERQDLTTWFEARNAARAERTDQYRVTSASLILSQLGDSIKATGAAMTDAEAAATWRALAEVAKALRKAGHPKPKPKPPTPVESGQADLLGPVHPQ